MLKDFRHDTQKAPVKDVMGELTFSNMMSIQALANLLIKKNLISKDELIAETRRVKERWELMKDMNMETK
jgi:hypothetical protein